MSANFNAAHKDNSHSISASTTTIATQTYDSSLISRRRTRSRSISPDASFDPVSFAHSLDPADIQTRARNFLINSDFVSLYMACKALECDDSEVPTKTVIAYAHDVLEDFSICYEMLAEHKHAMEFRVKRSLQLQSTRDVLTLFTMIKGDDSKSAYGVLRGMKSDEFNSRLRRIWEYAISASEQYMNFDDNIPDINFVKSRFDMMIKYFEGYDRPYDKLMEMAEQTVAQIKY